MSKITKKDMNIGAKIKLVRNSIDKNKKQFSKLLSVSQPTITRYEDGSRLPDYKFLKNLFDKLNVNPNWFFCDIGPVFKEVDDNNKMLVMNASGEMINPYNLKDKDFDVKIIAQTLSRVCRFWSQTSEFYSVAQHCLVMESYFEDIELKKWAMMHEVFEGLTGMDVPSPIKNSPEMRAYKIAEIKALKQASKIFNLSENTPIEIKEIDNRLMATEALRFMNTSNYDWCENIEPLPASIIGEPMSMKEAEVAFLAKWNELF